MMRCNSGGVGGVEGKVDLAKKNSFLESLVAIGEGFQEIFAGFGSAIGDVFGFNLVKVGDKKSKVGEHFKEIGDGLTTTNNKLKELEGKILEAKNADGVTIEAVKGAIKGANDVFTRLITSLTKLADVTNDGSDIGDTVNNAAVAANVDDVKTIIENVKVVIELADKSGVKIRKGYEGEKVDAAGDANTAPAVLTHNAGAASGGSKLAEEVVKADPWAMIDKIKNSTTNIAVLAGNDKDAGTLATGGAVANGAGAKSNADLVAAVALKAMTKGGKFSANADAVTVKSAAASAVNKVLRILDVIMRKTVSNNLEKVSEAIKGIKYSETSGSEASQSDATQPVVTK
nr:variable large family protein [Borrelia duttonii]